jgi:hypothetical protein
MATKSTKEMEGGGEMRNRDFFRDIYVTQKKQQGQHIRALTQFLQITT